MRKIKILYLLLVVSVLALCFTECRKSGPSTVKIHCCYVNGPNDTVRNVDSVWVEVDTSRISPHYRVDSVLNEAGEMQYIPRVNYCNEDIRNARGYTMNGFIDFTFAQPTIIVVNAYDTIHNEDGSTTYYKGKAEITLHTDVQVEENIFLTPYTSY